MTARTEVQKLVDDYWKWMRDRTVLKEADDNWIEINTPFTDRYNDGIQLYLKKVGEKYKISDDHFAFNDLITSGVNIKTPKRAEIIGEILKSYGVTETNGMLTMDITPSEYPFRMHNFVQAILEIGGLHSVASDHVFSYFIEDVSQWLDSKGVVGNKYASIFGSSGVPYRVDFLVGGKISDTSVTIIQTLSSPSKQSFATKVALPLLDIGRVRPAKFIAIVNDSKIKEPFKNDLVSISESSNVETVMWSQREQVEISVF